MTQRRSNRKKVSLSTLAEIYYERDVSLRWKQILFKKELEHGFGHHLSLRKRIGRKGWHRRRKLPPAMMKIITERLGEP